LVTAENVLSHGVRGRISSGKGMLVQIEYDDGEPMSYSSIEIFDSEKKLPFQSGRTDRNGRFLFYPDKMGDWKVVVNDGLGHRIALTANCSKAFNLKKTDEPETRSNSFLLRSERALMGISIILGLCGILFWWRGKKIYRRINQEHDQLQKLPEEE